ncbi:MAG TPA: gephyrin-like molybdotransferase Glp [Vicinamibacterales bacterium]
MRPFQSTITLDEARRRIAAAIQSIDRTETVPLENAHGRVLAAAIVAPIDNPPFDRSAMDGYAVRSLDTSTASRTSPAVLRCVGRAYTAEPFSGSLAPGECVEIATGAPVPESADAIVMVEDTARPGSGDWPAPAWLDSAESVLVLSPALPGQHVVRRGADVRAGETVVEAGTPLDASRVGAIAAVGFDRVTVFARPRVAIFPTGNEVVPPGRPLPIASVYDINSYTVAALVERHGGEPRRFPSVRDTIADVREALDRAADADVIVLAGGSSVGERDVIVDAVAERGEVIFHGIAVKPGKPTLFARIPRAAGVQLVFGMPGNPTSCLSNVHVLLVPALRALAHLPPHEPVRLRRTLASAVSSPRNRHQFLPVRLEVTQAVPTFKGSGEITSLSSADGYVEIPIGVDRLEAGEEVEVTIY